MCTSIVKDFKSKLLYRYKKTRITTLRDNTIQGATEMVELKKCYAQTIAFQVGSNDLEDRSPERVANDMENFILITKRLVPGGNIVVCELLPRYYRNVSDRREYENKRVKFNQILADICLKHDVKLVHHHNIT